jgi:hypothetical protein
MFRAATFTSSEPAFTLPTAASSSALISFAALVYRCGGCTLQKRTPQSHDRSLLRVLIRLRVERESIGLEGDTLEHSDDSDNTI